MLDIKSFQETLNKGYCGPGSLKIVLSYFGVEKTEEELVQLFGIADNSGVDDEQIKKVAESLGFKVEIKNDCDFTDIEKWLYKKVPVIVDWFTRGRSDYDDSSVSDGHYSVVVGLDDEYIYLQDPEIGKIRKLNGEDFMTVWFDFRGKIIDPNELIIRQIIAVYK